MLLLVPSLRLPRTLIMRLGHAVWTCSKVAASLAWPKVCLHDSLRLLLLPPPILSHLRNPTAIKILLDLAICGISGWDVGGGRVGSGLADWPYLFFGKALIHSRGFEKKLVHKRFLPFKRSLFPLLLLWTHCQQSTPANFESAPLF